MAACGETAMQLCGTYGRGRWEGTERGGEGQKGEGRKRGGERMCVCVCVCVRGVEEGM